MRCFILTLFVCTFFSISSHCQFTKYDTLRGSLSSLRSCYDVTYYDLYLKVNVEQHSIAGWNKVSLSGISEFQTIQLDLFESFSVDSIVFEKDTISWTRDRRAIFVAFPRRIHLGENVQLQIYYHGIPTTAVNPPWDGGFIWRKDSLDRPWIGVSCEGIGASLWWPNKDHLSDEPDSMCMSFEVPSGLQCISNGNLQNISPANDSYNVYTWKTSYPINNYNVTLNIGAYVQIKDSMPDGLQLDYYVLDYHKHIAEKHFKQVKPILQYFSKAFGNYPFVKDGYALVETSYLGMEHQSAISYGNKFINDVFDFDFIILHETAHEWWGNSVSTEDHGELWIHEAFATYSETLFLESQYGKIASQKYLNQQKTYIKNKQPVLGPLGINYNNWQDTDMYYKGAWMLHTLRNAIGDDTVWFAYIHKLADTFKISSINTIGFKKFLNEFTGRDYSYLIDQYLGFTELPILEYYFKKKGKKNILFCRWKANVKNFSLPLEVKFDNLQRRITPIHDWCGFDLGIQNIQSFDFDKDHFYIEIKKIKK